jgi:hypothetical protein
MVVVVVVVSAGAALAVLMSQVWALENEAVRRKLAGWRRRVKIMLLS